MVSPQFAFEWWGILIALVGLAVLAMAPAVWWVSFFQMTAIAIILYLFAIRKTSGAPVV